MISAWDVYWVMQLDSIRSSFGLMALLLFVVSMPALFVSVLAAAEGEPWAPSVRKFAALAVATAGVLFLARSFLPSTKTAATMIVLPAIANNETLHKEAGELYGLAKQALQDAVGGKEGER